MNHLMLSCGSERVSRDVLRWVATPKETDTWKPVPHYDVAELVTSVAEKRGYQIVSEEYGLNPSGSKMFGVLRFHPEGHPEFSRALGVRNSHDKSFALGLTVGLNVIVCSNLAFGGETTITRRHTSGIDIDQLVPQAFGNLEQQFIRLEMNVGLLKSKPVSLNEARIIAVRAAEHDVIPSSDIVPVLKEFQEPCHEEFSDRNRWSLYNCFTEVAKKYTPCRADKCYRGLADLFKLAA